MQVISLQDLIQKVTLQGGMIRIFLKLEMRNWRVTQLSPDPLRMQRKIQFKLGVLDPRSIPPAGHGAGPFGMERSHDLLPDQHLSENASVVRS